jgi:hypothetical protein
LARKWEYGQSGDGRLRSGYFEDYNGWPMVDTDRYQTQTENAHSQSNALLWMILSWGIILRLVQYISNRSLWLDEATLSLNIVNRSFPELLKPLDYGQTAPFGFLVLERLAGQLFGTGEYALRLFPLLCGLLSLLLVYRIAQLSLSPKAVPIATGLFAISGPLIYYASEVKPYSTDVAITLLLLLTAIHYASCELTPRRVATFAVLGAVSIWFSYPSLFVLAGAGMGLASLSLLRRRWSRAGGLFIAFSFWGLSFAGYYLISLRYLVQNRMLKDYFTFGFIPYPSRPLVTINWFIDTFFAIFRDPGGFELSGIAAFACLVGGAAMLASQRERLVLLLSPIMFTLVAAGLHKYPFAGRLLLFLVPVLILFIAEGASQIGRETSRQSSVIGACLVGLLFLKPLLFSTYHLIKPSAESLPVGVDHTREEIKPVLKYVEEHGQQGDILYVRAGSVPAFRYYEPRFHLSKLTLIPSSPESVGSWEMYERDIDQLRGYHRVWVLLSHAWNPATGNEEKILLYFLDKRGTMLQSFPSSGAAVYLYDLAAARTSASGDARLSPTLPH